MAYLKQEFMEYLHEKGNANPGAYCNGLDNVEKILSVDVDAEYARDECKSIYVQLQDLRKHPEKIGKAEHVIRQYASRLQKYIEFRAWKHTASEITPTDFEEPQLATTGEKVEQTASAEYWPSLEEYNPNLTKEDWKRYIQRIELPNHPSPMEMLKGIMMLGGEATCAKLSKVYGGHPSRYVGCAVNLGKRAKKYFDLPAHNPDGRERFYTIPFLGREVTEDGVTNYSYLIRSELLEALMEIDLSEIDPYNPVGYDTEESSVPNTFTDVPLNTILYGPPGTGKTYHTIIYAVAIIENRALEDVASEFYDDVHERFIRYMNEGLINFTTFHQSYGYEEFIEGIKPIVGGASGIEYSVEDGVFKAFCGHAQLPQTHDFAPDAKIWRVVLGNGNLVTSNTVKYDCFNGNKIAFNWNAQEDHVGTYNYNQITHFRERINVGDVVVSYAGNGTDIDKIGIVTGDAEFDERAHSYKWSRSVKWLDWIHPHHPVNIKKLNGDKYFDNDMLQQLKRVNLSELIKLLCPKGTSSSGKNHVFIIDEINRGNISKIFGELITLIEPSKRIGAAEELTSVLPYSQQTFGVPNNVYIIGTMNTADRSIAAIDTALRRRFQFREMMPDADVLADITVEGISISDMLTRMNKRIEVLYDREHTIGHAYFMPLKDSPTIETLASIFSDRIIPLLQEYFYEDYEKIRLVLGDNRKSDDSITFITKKPNSYAELFGTMDLDLDEGYTYEINKAAFGSIDSYKSI